MRHIVKSIIVANSLLLAGCDSGEAPSAWSEYTHKGAYSATLSLNGTYAVIGSFEHGGSLWSLDNHNRLYNWNHQTTGFSIIAATAFSPDEKYAATANQQDLVLWNTNTGQSAGFWSSPAEIMQMDLSPNGDYALLGLADHTAVYFDVKNGGIKRTFRHKARVRSVDLSADGSLALTGTDAYKTKLWDIETGTLLQELTFSNVVDTVALAPDMKIAFSAGSLDKAVIWDINSGKEIHVISNIAGFTQKKVSYLSARFSPDSQQLLTGTASGLVQLWDISTGKELRSWRLHRRNPYGPVHAGVYAVGFGEDVYYAIGSNGIMNTLQ